MRTTGCCIAVVSPVLQVVTNVKDKSVTIATAAILIFSLAATSDFRREERHLRIIPSMCPHSRVCHIIAISPVPFQGLLLQSMSHQTVVLLEVVDLHEPAPIHLTLQPGVFPVGGQLGEKILRTRLRKKVFNNLLSLHHM